MTPSLYRSGPKQAALHALVVVCLLSVLGITAMRGDRLPVFTNDTHASQRASAVASARAQRSCPNARVRDEFSNEEIIPNATCRVNTSSDSAIGGNMSACLVADDDSSDESGAMSDNSDDSSAPVYGLLSNDTKTARVVIAQEIIHHSERAWIPAMFSGIYQSGAAPPSYGTNENCQDAWLGGNGGGAAVALRIIGGELKQDAPECFGRMKIGLTKNARVLRVDETRRASLRNFQDGRTVACAHRRFCNQPVISPAFPPAIPRRLPACILNLNSKL